MLVIDPSDAIRARLIARLREAGLDVCGEANCCSSGLTAIAALAPDAVVLDVRLPDHPALLCLQAVRTRAGTAVIVVLTNDMHYRRIALASGADHFLDKSVEFDAVASVLGAR